MVNYRIFVYGTLKRLQPNHHNLWDSRHGIAKFIADGVTEQKYPLVVASSANIPFLLHSPGIGKHVHGEVYDVDERMLCFLDDFEANGVLYDREPIQVVVSATADTAANGVSSTLEECHAYLLKNFKQDLLKKEMITNYDLKTSVSYKKHVDRDEEDNVREQVKG